jgi:SAM-dependent methyltransferase
MQPLAQPFASPRPPEPATLRLALADALAAADDPRGARTELERILAAHPGHAAALERLARIALRLGDAGAVLRLVGPHVGALSDEAELAVGTAALAVRDVRPTPLFDALAARAHAARATSPLVAAGLRANGRADLLAPAAARRPPGTGAHPESTLADYFRRLWEVDDLDACAHARDTFRWLMGCVRAVGPDDVVLDAGAGQCRYAPFFAHARYVPVDFGEGDANWNYDGLAAVADLEALPFAPCSISLVFNTSVMEHVRHPARAMREFWRVLRWGGSLRMYVPFHYNIHQPPHDYFRFTSHAWRVLCAEAGFGCVEVREASGDFYAAAHWFRQVTLETVRRLSEAQRHAVGLFLLEVVPMLEATYTPQETPTMPIGYFVDAWKEP